ncbi:MAG TPA: permease [Candidatus Brocadiia bacterium]|nr:permease [Candidatus Brocadiia bacterium]
MSGDGHEHAAPSLAARAAPWLEGAFLLLALAMAPLGAPQGKTRAFGIAFASIMLEAAPFMLAGALIGGMVESFVSRDKMAGLLPRRAWVTAFLAAVMGMLFPVCECAIVPVVRRLARKGLPPSAAIAYLLAGPIVNPVTALSTALAYRSIPVAAARLGAGFVIAVAVARLAPWLLGRDKVFRADLGHDSHGGRGHVHGEACGCGHARSDEPAGARAKMLAAVRHAADDFLDVGHFLVIGALIAAASQTFVDRAFFATLSSTPFAPVLLMMALAVMLNVCSEADAFIAASFRGLAPFPAQLAFMVVGPMFDLKLLLMYSTLFRKRATILVAGLVLLFSFAAGAGAEIGRFAAP